MQLSRTRLDYRPSPHSGYAMTSRRIVLCFTTALLLSAICGCESSTRNAMANAYYRNPDKDLRTLGRVTLVELDNASTYPEISGNATGAIFLELQKKQVFGVARIGRDAPAWRPLQENLEAQQAMQALAEMRESLKCNGLLVGTVTEYRPYPSLVLGLRLKLLDLTDGQLLWAVEQVWDSADKSIHGRVREYLKRDFPLGPTTLREQLVVVSPLEFTKFAAYEVAQTLDARK